MEANHRQNSLDVCRVSQPVQRWWLVSRHFVVAGRLIPRLIDRVRSGNSEFLNSSISLNNNRYFIVQSTIFYIVLLVHKLLA